MLLSIFLALAGACGVWLILPNGSKAEVTAQPAVTLIPKNPLPVPATSEIEVFRKFLVARDALLSMGKTPEEIEAIAGTLWKRLLLGQEAPSES